MMTELCDALRNKKFNKDINESSSTGRTQVASYSSDGDETCQKQFNVSFNIDGKRVVF